MDKKSRYVASLLSVLTPGLGQIYNAQLRKGLLLQVFNQLPGAFLCLFSPTAVVTDLTIASLLMFLLVMTVTAYIYSIIDAYRTARNQQNVRVGAYSKWYFYAAFLLCFWTVGALIHAWGLWKTYNIPNTSMEPTLKKGDHILVDKGIYSQTQQPKRGDVIVFVFPEDKTKNFIKRVIGIPGDIISIKNKSIIVNGQPLKEDYVKYDPFNDNNPVTKMDNLPEKVVPAGKYYVLGDYRDRSYDSRFWGFVDNDALIGKAILIYYAPERKRIMTEIH